MGYLLLYLFKYKLYNNVLNNIHKNIRTKPRNFLIICPEINKTVQKNIGRMKGQKKRGVIAAESLPAWRGVAVCVCGVVDKCIFGAAQFQPCARACEFLISLRIRGPPEVVFRLERKSPSGTRGERCESGK